MDGNSRTPCQRKVKIDAAARDARGFSTDLPAIELRKRSSVAPEIAHSSGPIAPSLLQSLWRVGPLVGAQRVSGAQGTAETSTRGPASHPALAVCVQHPPTPDPPVEFPLCAALIVLYDRICTSRVLLQPCLGHLRISSKCSYRTPTDRHIFHGASPVSPRPSDPRSRLALPASFAPHSSPHATQSAAHRVPNLQPSMRPKTRRMCCHEPHATLPDKGQRSPTLRACRFVVESGRRRVERARETFPESASLGSKHSWRSTYRDHCCRAPAGTECVYARVPSRFIILPPTPPRG